MITQVPVKKIIPHPKNARRGNISKIQDSIRHHGFLGALVVQKSTGHILVGNHRYKAAIALGGT
jgi:ParB-like chromosome segregation protein Spo0J